MDARHRSRPGKIRGLIDLIDQHPDEIAYDWRSRFGLPLEALADGRMSWDEAWSLTQRLMADPTSHLRAAVAGWAHPWPYEARVLADLYDLTLAANTDKKHRGRTRPYQRPWSKTRGRRSTKPTVNQAAIRAALAARGH